jgi:endonuclease YncB( thermonuclease family)
MNFSESASVGLTRLSNPKHLVNDSRQHLSDLVFGRLIELHTRGLDRYGLVLTSTSNWYAAAWRGFTIGMLSTPAPDIQAGYRQAETEASEQERGLWSEPDPIPPWGYRCAARQAK